MAKSPLLVLAIIMLTLTGEALIFGESIAERSFPTFDQPETSGVFAALDGVIAVLQGAWGVVVFFFNLITFNVPDAPYWVRVPVGVLLGGGLIWSIGTFFRGN